MDYRDWLRRLALNDECFAVEPVDEIRFDSALDPKIVALTRLAAMIAVGAAVASYAAEVDSAVEAGATDDEIVTILLGLIAVVGRPRVVAEAPKLALAMGYDTEAAFEAREP